MPKLQVFDPALCCSTGVCGTTVDPALPAFAADLAWLAEQGVTVERFNLAQQPGAFVDGELGEQGAIRRQLLEQLHRGPQALRERGVIHPADVPQMPGTVPARFPV